MKALIDADIVAYRVACTCQEDDAQDFVFARAEDLVDSILVNTEADEYRLFLTGKDNFRYTIYPEYKAHRPKEKPFWLEACRQYLIATFNAEVIDGQEADDAMGINQTEDTVICSIDKDLLMIPGHHYNFVKDEKIYISNFTGIYNFYMQCLTGDRSDNIKGIEKIGPKKAEKILFGCTNEKEMFDAVREAYSNDEEFIMNGRVLWIRRKDNEDWKDRFNALVQEQVGRTSLDNTEERIPVS
jgi:DNA polymerase-1